MEHDRDQEMKGGEGSKEQKGEAQLARHFGSPLAGFPLA
tara:strand:- start:396 stop:512 length:117 start_codon:yes stop_codon:yes gene_type:complete